jgi:hypothetical protein
MILMKRCILLLAFVLTSTASAQEAINLTVPITQPSIANYTPGSLFLQLVPDPRITVTIIGTDGKGQVFEYPCATPCANDTPAKVATLIGQLNTVNLTTRSLWKRIFDRLVLDFPTRFPGGATVP